MSIVVTPPPDGLDLPDTLAVTVEATGEWSARKAASAAAKADGWRVKTGGPARDNEDGSWSVELRARKVVPA